MIIKKLLYVIIMVSSICTNTSDLYQSQRFPLEESMIINTCATAALMSFMFICSDTTCKVINASEKTCSNVITNKFFQEKWKFNNAIKQTDKKRAMDVFQASNVKYQKQEQRLYCPKEEVSYYNWQQRTSRFFIKQENRIQQPALRNKKINKNKK